MIKASELRIGNCILYGGDVCVVDGLQFQPEAPASKWRITFRTIGTDNPTGGGLRSGKFENWIDSIPLTPEILEKCGFIEKETINSDGDECNWQQRDIQGGRNFLTYYWGKLDLHDAAFDLSHIKHLHQLQNLYFALTGEELNVQL